MSKHALQNTMIIQNITHRLEYLRSPDLTDLMVSFEGIIRNDNLRGILQGTDKDGIPLQEVTYRPKDKVVSIGSKAAEKWRLGQKASRKHDLIFAGRGPAQSGLHNNLTTAEYQQLDGPPLAPRRQFSRVISNLKTTHTPEMYTQGVTEWMAIGYWDEVVARDGATQFLPYHFNGDPLGKNGPSIVRDLRGLRPEGWREISAAYQNWLMLMYTTMGVA